MAWIINHRVGYELRFVDENEKVSVADFFIPGHRDHRVNVLCVLCGFFVQEYLKSLLPGELKVKICNR